MAATWDPVKKRYVDDSSTPTGKGGSGAMASTGYREGEGDDEAQARKITNAANSEAASTARHQEVKGSGLGTAGENALKEKKPAAASAPLTGAQQLEAMRKRRQQLTSY